jgi:L-amino acid N-acyltransferase YncA
MVRIRPARESDAGAVAAIYSPFVDHTAVSFETTPPGRDEMLRRIVVTTAVYPWLVCELDGSVVGYAYATQHRVRAAYQWSVDTSAYVESPQQRRGVGRGLYASLLAVLRAQGFVNAYAGITLPNLASVGLHEAVGFTRIGVYERAGYKLGTWHDVGWWQLALQAHAESPAEPLALSAVMTSPEWERLMTSGEELIRGRTA